MRGSTHRQALGTEPCLMLRGLGQFSDALEQGGELVAGKEDAGTWTNLR